MRYYSEPFQTVKMTVLFSSSAPALEFHSQLSARPDVFGLLFDGQKVTYWCLDRSFARDLAVQFERDWVERHHLDDIKSPI